MKKDFYQSLDELLRKTPNQGWSSRVPNRSGWWAFCECDPLDRPPGPNDVVTFILVNDEIVAYDDEVESETGREVMSENYWEGTNTNEMPPGYWKYLCPGKRGTRSGR